eukprot:1073310-Pyramimonas_sp.AAC.1
MSTPADSHPRLVDEIFVSMLKDEGLYDKIWQAFAVHLPIRSVGVQGDCRTHAHVVALRAITSADGMTADWYTPLDHTLLRVYTLGSYPPIFIYKHA